MNTEPAPDIDRVSSLHIARTTLAVAASAAIARVCHLPEPMWAIVTAFMVTQSSLGATWEVSRQRLIGSLVGSGFGALLVMWFQWNFLLLVIGTVVTGWICSRLRLSPSAYRFAGVTMVIVAMPSYNNPAWVISIHRCLEVCVGIFAGMAILALWHPRADTATAAPSSNSTPVATDERVSESRT